jgi:hypothetical protein
MLTVRRVSAIRSRRRVTILPVAMVAGGGGGGNRAEQAGAGFGVRARPAGVFVVRNGDAAWRPALDVNRVVLGGQLVAVIALLTRRPVLMRWLAHRSAAVPAG